MIASTHILPQVNLLLPARTHYPSRAFDCRRPPRRVTRASRDNPGCKSTSRHAVRRTRSRALRPLVECGVGGGTHPGADGDARVRVTASGGADPREAIAQALVAAG